MMGFIPSHIFIRPAVSVLRRVGEVAADDRRGHGGLVGQQEQQRADHVLRLPDADRGAPARVVGAGIGVAILRGVDDAGRDEIEAHAMLRDLPGGALRERDQRRLARGIGGRTRPALVRQPRGEGDDASLPARDHAGDRRLVAPDDAVEIGAQDAIPRCRLHGVNERPRLHCRRANEAVDPAETALDVAEDRENFAPVGNVETPRGNPGDIGERGHRRRVEVADDHPSAGPRRRPRQGAADAVGAAGHHDHVSLALEVRPHGSPRPLRR
ncbi:MAG: hypothetical protein WBW74_08120, partial [Xanthobacteraceae bacterium]